jgi:hypothetical protein
VVLALESSNLKSQVLCHNSGIPADEVLGICSCDSVVSMQLLLSCAETEHPADSSNDVSLVEVEQEAE